MTDDWIVSRGDLVVDPVNPHQTTFHLRVDAIVRPIVELHLATPSPANLKTARIFNLTLTLPKKNLTSNLQVDGLANIRKRQLGKPREVHLLDNLPRRLHSDRGLAHLNRVAVLVIVTAAVAPTVLHPSLSTTAANFTQIRLYTENET